MVIRRFFSYLFLFFLPVLFHSIPVWAGGIIEEFPIPFGNPTPLGITAGPDGNIWFLEDNTNQVGRVTPEGQNFQEFDSITPDSGLEQITTGPDGNLWFTELQVNKIGRMTPQGVVQEFDLPNLPLEGSAPEDIISGPDGNLWFTEGKNNKIGRITPQGQITEFEYPSPGSFAIGITVGPEGDLWFTADDPERIIRMTPQGVVDAEFELAPNSDPFGIALGSDGNLWFCEENTNKIGRMTPDGELTEFDIPTPGSIPLQIVAGEDGHLYFTEDTGNKIGQVDTQGNIREFEIPTPDSNPFDIAVGPEGDIWFTESAEDQLGKLLTPGIQFSMENYSVGENAGTATITVQRVAGSSGAFTVNYSTQNGTAVAGEDYQATSGSLSWADGDTADKTFNVTILNNGETDGDRNLFLNLTDPNDGTALGALAQAVLTIVDDEGGGGGCRLDKNIGADSCAGWTILMILGLGLYRFLLFRRT